MWKSRAAQLEGDDGQGLRDIGLQNKEISRRKRETKGVELEDKKAPV